MNLNTFQALAEPNRLQIIELLRTSPRSVNEISSMLHFGQPKTSKHLRVLADSGLVLKQTVAQQRIYSINTKPMQELEDWAAKMAKVWDARFNRLDKILAKEKTKHGK